MKIGIDIRCLSEGKRTGVEEYVLNLLPEVFEKNKEDEFVLFFNSFKETKADFSWAKKYPNVKIKKFRFPNKIFNLFLWYFNFPKLDWLLGEIDIFFMPNIGFGSVSRKCRLFLTVHDLSFERYSKFFSIKRRFWHLFINPKKLCQKADKLVAVSDSTKNDLISLYGIKPEKIETIHSAISEKFKVIDRNDPVLIQVKEKYQLPYKFILYLGTIEPRKNIQSLIRAFEKLKVGKNEEILKYKLVIAGAKGWLFEKIFIEIENSEFRDDIIYLDFIEDKDKEFVYNLASLFVYPSFFEGFGFPPLEAMACGVPVICSNNSSLPEVCGEAAIMIDPDRPSEITEAMKEILTSSKLKESLIQKGLIQAQKFSWQKTARRFLDML